MTGPDGLDDDLAAAVLRASGASAQRVSAMELDACLSWLANFHATFMGARPEGLWAIGTYWHLATRPDELGALPDGPVKAAATTIDRRLANSAFRTFVHGDAKLANFCFDADGRRAAAVDFQYVGGGCGMEDVAYFMSSCLDEDESDRLAPDLLDRYFELLGDALKRAGKVLDFGALELIGGPSTRSRCGDERMWRAHERTGLLLQNYRA